MNTLHGLEVHIASAYPNMQCSPEFERLQDPALVAATNAWMASFFGYTSLIPDGEVWGARGSALFMTQATYNKLFALYGDRK